MGVCNCMFPKPGGCSACTGYGDWGSGGTSTTGATAIMPNAWSYEPSTCRGKAHFFACDHEETCLCGAIRRQVGLALDEVKLKALEERLKAIEEQLTEFDESFCSCPDCEDERRREETLDRLRQMTNMSRMTES